MMAKEAEFVMISSDPVEENTNKAMMFCLYFGWNWISTVAEKPGGAYHLTLVLNRTVAVMETDQADARRPSCLNVEKDSPDNVEPGVLSHNLICIPRL